MWVLGLVIMVDQIDQNIVRGVVPQLKEAFGIDDAAIGLLLSAFVLVNGLVTVPAGYLADRWNRTRTIGHTVLGWSVITMLTAAATNFATLLGLRALLGFGQAITEPSAASLLSDYYPTSQRGKVFSNQQVMGFLGIGFGIAIGGAVGSHFGWQAAFLIVGPPSIAVAFLAYALHEPKRGHGDRVHLGVADDDEPDPHVPLFEDGFRRFFVDMVHGLRDDFRTIWAIPTLRYALVGVSSLMFTVAGIGAWLPQFHERFSGMTQDQATQVVGGIIILGGIPGVLLGGRLADRFANRVRGARVVIPAYCIGVGNTIFIVSYLPIPAWASVFLQLIGIFAVTAAIPALAGRNRRRGARAPARRRLRRVQPGVDPVRRGRGAAARRHPRRRLEPACRVPRRLPARLRRRVDPLHRAQPSRRRRDEDLRGRRARDAGRRSAPEPVSRRDPRPETRWTPGTGADLQPVDDEVADVQHADIQTLDARPVHRQPADRHCARERPRRRPAAPSARALERVRAVGTGADRLPAHCAPIVFRPDDAASGSGFPAGGRSCRRPYRRPGSRRAATRTPVRDHRRRHRVRPDPARRPRTARNSSTYRRSRRDSSSSRVTTSSPSSLSPSSVARRRAS